LEERVPTVLAEERDNCGLQVGSPLWEVGGILVSLNPTLEALTEALRLNANLLITHHPLFFAPLTRIDLGQLVSKIAEKALSSRIAIVSVHTNWDRVDQGVSDALADVLDIRVRGVLDDGPRERMAKLIVFAPVGAEEKVRDALFDGHSGVIGRYSHCSFALRGEGSYQPLKGSQPHVGQVGKLERAEEFRLEVILPRSSVQSVLDRLKSVHPYEEVAYDVYPLLNPTHRGGMGRIGYLPEPMKLNDLLDKVKEKLGITMVKFVGDRSTKVEKVALCGGAGSGLWERALRSGAEVYISGEFRYHEALSARTQGLCLVDIGHFASEYPAVKALGQSLTRWISQERGIAVYVFDRETDVFEWA
jgi:dinuclear metal center YbgI/SA1388 family protein